MGNQSDFTGNTGVEAVPAAPPRDRYAKAVLKAFDAASYTATVQLTGNVSAYLAGVAVSRGIPPAEMTAGRYVLVAVFGGINPADAAVIGIWS